MTGEVITPPWLSTDGLLTQFAAQREKAIRNYTDFVAQGIGQKSIWNHLNRQVFLGENNFVLRMQDKIKKLSKDVNIPKAQRRPPALPLKEIEKPAIVVIMLLWQLMLLANIVANRLRTFSMCTSRQ